MKSFDWQTWTADPLVSLASGEVHPYFVSLNLNADCIKAVERVLSPDQLMCARRFRFQHHRDSYISARAILARVLAIYLNAEPEDLRFRCGGLWETDRGRTPA